MCSVPAVTLRRGGAVLPKPAIMSKSYSAFAQLGSARGQAALSAAKVTGSSGSSSSVPPHPQPPKGSKPRPRTMELLTRGAPVGLAPVKRQRYSEPPPPAANFDTMESENDEAEETKLKDEVASLAAYETSSISSPDFGSTYFRDLMALPGRIVQSQQSAQQLARGPRTGRVPGGLDSLTTTYFVPRSGDPVAFGDLKRVNVDESCTTDVTLMDVS